MKNTEVEYDVKYTTVFLQRFDRRGLSILQRLGDMSNGDVRRFVKIGNGLGYLDDLEVTAWAEAKLGAGSIEELLDLWREWDRAPHLGRAEAAIAHSAATVAGGLGADGSGDSGYRVALLVIGGGAV